MKQQQFESTLLLWYATHKRDLPWRHTTEPYKILVSEVMLQQTQVSRVVEYYKRFLELFPTVEALAKALTSEIIQAWAGLGYNRRAVLLQKCAQAVVARGSFPKSPFELEQLPAIGPYTAAAVASFSRNYPAVVVDTNVRRVFSRLFCGVENADLKKVTNLAKEFLPQHNSREWNNAVMEFGALICNKTPQCTSCPFAKHCPALLKGFPQGIKKKTQTTFEGSRRQARGKILSLLREKSQTVTQLKKSIPRKDVQELLSGLEHDGLIVVENKLVRLP